MRSTSLKMALLGNLGGPSKSPYPQVSNSFFSTTSSPSSSASNVRIKIREQDLANPLQYLSLYDTPIDMVKCERCENSKPDSWKCLNCHIFLCLSCIIDHQQAHATKDHQIVYCPLRRHHNSGSLSSSSRESGSPPLHSAYLTNHFCDIHNEPHKLYCEKCIRTSCHSCHEITEGCHHRPIFIHEAIAKAKRANSYFESEIESIIREIRDGIQRADISKMHNEKTCQLVQCDIVENYTRLHERFTNLMRHLTNEKKEKEKNLDMHKGRLDMVLKKMKSTAQALKDSLLSDNPWDVIIAKERAARDIRNFKQREINILCIDDSEITFVPPEDDVFRRITISIPEYRAAMNSSGPRNRPVYGISRPVVVKKPEGTGNTIVIGGQGVDEGQLCRPWGVCCNSKGQIIVADRSNDRIQVFNPDGTFLRAFGTHGNNVGELDRPAGVAVNPNGHIIVADKDNHRIQIFTIEGELIRTFGRKGSYQGQFNYPWDVACNSKGQIVVSDSRNHRIQLFDENGTYIRMYGYELNGACYKNFDTPRGVCFTPNDEVIITDFNNHKLLKLDITFERTPRYIGCEGTEVKQFKRPQGVICDDNGNLIIADSRNDRIQVLDSMGNFLWSIGYTGRGKGELDTPSGICLTPEGRIVVVDYGNHRVQIF